MRLMMCSAFKDYMIISRNLLTVRLMEAVLYHCMMRIINRALASF